MSLVERLNAGAVITAWSGVPDPLTVEILAGQAYDAVTLDMQHGGHSDESVLRCIPAVMARGLPAVVRVPVGRFDMASRALDFGAEAVIAPMVNSIEDAQRFAVAMKYPPIGERSWGPGFAMPRHGGGTPTDWLKGSNARTVSFAMIETRAALDRLDGILDTPGIDAIFLGPADFSIAWTRGATIDAMLEDMMAKVEDVARRTRAAGKHAGFFLNDMSSCGRFVSMGFNFLALGSEHSLIRTGAETVLSAARKSMA